MVPFPVFFAAVPTIILRDRRDAPLAAATGVLIGRRCADGFGLATHFTRQE